MSSAAAGLPPGYGRRGSNPHEPGPLTSEAGASANSATSAWRVGPATAFAVDARSANQVDPEGLKPTFSSLQGGAPPLVRWAQRSAGAGVEPAVPKAAALRPGAVPRRRPAEGTGKDRAVTRRGGRSHCWRSLQFSRCYLDATNQGFVANQLVALGGSGGRRTPSHVGLEAARLPVHPLLRVLLSLLRPARNQKSRSLARAARAVMDHESPGQTVEDASLGRSSKDMSWPKAAGEVTRVASGSSWSPIHRWLRSQCASLYRMSAKYMDVAGIWEYPNCGLSMFVRMNQSK